MFFNFQKIVGNNIYQSLTTTILQLIFSLTLKSFTKYRH